LAKSTTVEPSRNASSAIFAFSAASIFRLSFVITRSVYHDGASQRPIKPMVPKTGSISGLAMARLNHRRRP
jgi:hypothetical protein